jgi:hypothetical protein
MTPQRLAVLRVLAASQGHPTVERTYENVRAKFPTTSIATIFEQPERPDQGGCRGNRFSNPESSGGFPSAGPGIQAPPFGVQKEWFVSEAKF